MREAEKQTITPPGGPAVTHEPTRRGLLAGFAAAPVATILPPTSTPDADAELLRLCEQHIANVRAFEGAPDRFPGEADPFGDATDETRGAILNTPARSIAGLVAKARLATQQAEIDMCGDDWGHSDAGTWAQEVTLDLLRLYGEG